MPLVASAGLALGATVFGGPLEKEETRLYVDYSAKPPAEALLAFNLCILDPGADVDLRLGHENGNQYLAYLSTVEAAKGSALERLAEERKIPVLGKNDHWGSSLLDISAPSWQAAMVDSLASETMRLGYDGFFLDTVDSLTLLERVAPKDAASFRGAMLAMIRALHERYPDKSIVLNRGFDLLPDLRGIVKGVLVESVYQTFDPKTHNFKANSPADSAWLEGKIRSAQGQGLKVYAVDYVDPKDTALAKATADRLRALGCVPFITTSDLSGKVGAPVCAVPRRVMVLHGWDEAVTGVASAPADETQTAGLLAPALRWAGAVVEYFDIGGGVLPALPQEPIAGIVLDADLHLNAAQQMDLAGWVAEITRRGIPLLIQGQPWEDAAAWEAIRPTLGLKGSGALMPEAAKISVAALDNELALGGRVLQPLQAGFRDLQAPSGAQVLLSWRADTGTIQAQRYDACFVAPWGMLWNDPTALSLGPQVDLLKLASKWLPALDETPVPDTAMQNGHRIFAFHMQGAGFTTRAQFPGAPTCGEVFRSHILEEYALPVTVAIGEADVRGLSSESDPANAGEYEAVARSIYELPQVEAAANSFSRPTSWAAGAIATGPLNASAKDDVRGLRRELIGSLNYLQRQLLPAGKSMQMFLWPHGARPSAEALSICAQVNIAQLPDAWNPRWPSPESAMRAGKIGLLGMDHRRLQDADRLIRGWQESGAGVVSTPVHLAATFSQVADAEGLSVLQRTLDWCQAQPLHAMTAAQYARLSADAAATKVMTVGRDHWIILNSGWSRTLRLPQRMGVPDLDRCRGVVGWSTHNGMLYVQTMGRPLTELVLKDEAALGRQLHLVSASRPLHIHSRSPLGISVSTPQAGSVEVVVGGLEPGAMCTARGSGAPLHHLADAEGQARLTLPPRSVITLRATQLPYAAMR
ncbi:MAG: endo alpha-1,4 polygalactosaminidase [Verrucomicrobiaceae bacterium]|nr:endo alpha-1,4 polygalactosaminidase [Verrucomicrobiaceae bacterium]